MDVNVRLVIGFLAIIVLSLIAAQVFLSLHRVEAAVINPLSTLSGMGIGGLCSLLANSGNSVSAKSGGTIEVEAKEKTE